MLQNHWFSILKFYFNLFVICIGLAACGSRNISYADQQSSSVMLNKIEAQYKTWRNTPYRYGGNSKKGIDCSSLVMNFYSQKFSKSIPRMTVEQAKIGEKVTQLKAGDLVFFKTGRGNSGLHVGIYYKNGFFLHASTSKGVIYSNLKEEYWKSKYWKAMRIV